MFDTIKFPDIHFPSKIEVETPAPPDQIRLLNELRDQLIKDIVDRATVTDNTVNVHWTSVMNRETATLTMYGKVSINGKTKDITIPLHKFGHLRYDPKAAAKLFYEEVVRHISEMVAWEALGNLGGPKGFADALRY